MIGLVRNLFKRRAPRGQTHTDSKHPSVEERLAQHSDFRKLPIDDRILMAVGDLGFVHSTPVQKETLPHALAGKDITAMAQTGTGKTAAFLITIIQRALENKTVDRPKGSPLALVLAPTRELAVQIGKDAGELATHSDFKHVVVYGGTGYKQQAEALKGRVDMVVATPGRLIDYIGKKVLDLSKVDTLVIDEADRMLDMGFIPDVRRIVRKLPPREQRQTLLFSATLTDDVLKLAGQWMTDPVRVEIEPENIVAEEIQQLLYSVTTDNKFALLFNLIKQESAGRVLVFRNRRIQCEKLHRKLQQYGLNSSLMTGDVPQNKRTKVLENFRSGRVPVIVATDVAGRGIHVDNITHVVNFDLPYEPDNYVHRIGRTGRAGVKGVAVSFACEESAFVLPEIEKYIGQVLSTERPPDEMLKLPHPKQAPSGTDQNRGPGKRRKRGGNNNRRRR